LRYKEKNKIMKKILKVIAVALLVSTSVYADSIQKVSFETIDKGMNSQYEENNKQHIIEIHNQNEWQDFWSQHTSGMFPSSELPEINFQKHIVIVAIDEIRNSGGYTLEIKEIAVDTAAENRPFEIILELSQPGSAAGVTGALSRPYHIVKIKNKTL
jgi:hypothetical protein